MKKFLLISIAVISFSVSKAQILFSKTIGDTAYDCSLTKAVATSDSGYLLIVHIYQSDIFIKFNSNGDTSWTTNIYSTIGLTVNSIVELPNQGGYISCGSGGTLCHIEINGNIDWMKTYSGISYDDIIRTHDDSLIIVGQISGRLLLMKTDFSGNIAWVVKTPAGTQYFSPSKLLLDRDANLIIAGGRTYSIDNNHQNLLMKVGSNGNLIWSYSYEQEGEFIYTYFTGIDTTCDGQYILTNSFGDAHWFNWEEEYYMKVDTSGNVLWQRTLPVLHVRDRAFVYSLRNNRYGVISNGEALGGKLIIMTTDSMGIPLTTRIDTSSTVSNVGFAKTFSNQLLFLADTAYSGTQNLKTKIILADSVGNISCNMIDTNVVIVDTTTTVLKQILYMALDTTSIQIITPIFAQEKGISIVQTDCSTILNITEKSKLNEVTIFPNPTQGAFTISLTAKLKNAKTEIFNMLGRKVYSTTINSKQQTINNKFSSGIYFVKVTDGENQFVEKLIVQ